MKCPDCGHSEYPGTLFCSECGHRLWQGRPMVTMPLNPEHLWLTSDLEDDALASYKTAPLSVAIRIRVRGASNPIWLEGKEVFTLGRADPRNRVEPDLDLTPYDGKKLGVSRLHLTLRRDSEEIFVTDQGSSNGTVVNGRPLPPNESRQLQSGDEICLGKLVLNVYFGEE